MPDNALDINVFDKAVLLNLTLGVPGNSKKVDAQSVLASQDDSPSSAWMSVSKRLLDAKEFDEIKYIVGKIKRYLDRKTITSKSGKERPALKKFIKNGVYVLPLGLVAEVDAELVKFKLEFQAAVEKFLEVYPKIRDEAKVSLKGVFCESDYPPIEVIKNAFYVEFNYLNISTPQALEDISVEVFKREQAQAKKQWLEASQEIQLALRAGFQELVSWMADTLKPTEEGKRQKSFRGAGIAKLIEFLEDFDSKDILGDKELSAVVSKVKDILGGADVEAIQESSRSLDWRAEMSEKFTEIKTELSPLVSNAERLIILED